MKLKKKGKNGIIENLYKNEMVICDISGKNANVMLELGGGD